MHISISSKKRSPLTCIMLCKLLALELLSLIFLNGEIFLIFKYEEKIYIP